MTIDEAATILKHMVERGKASNEISVNIHLFGIKYADEISGMSLPDLTNRAGISENYKTEIRKGMNLSRYVQLKP